MPTTTTKPKAAGNGTHAARQPDGWKPELFELPVDRAVRVGRFRISRSAVSARQVSFDTKATTRVRITLLDGDEDEDLPAADRRGPAEPERPFEGDGTPPSRSDGNVVDLANAARRARDGQPPVVHP